MSLELPEASATLMIKLGSIATHTREMLSPGGSHFDKATLDSMLTDPEVVEWLEEMNVPALLPVMRGVGGG